MFFLVCQIKLKQVKCEVPPLKGLSLARSPGGLYLPSLVLYYTTEWPSWSASSGHLGLLRSRRVSLSVCNIPLLWALDYYFFSPVCVVSQVLWHLHCLLYMFSLFPKLSQSLPHASITYGNSFS